MQKCLSRNIFSHGVGEVPVQEEVRPPRNVRASTTRLKSRSLGRGAEEEKNWLANKGRLEFAFLPARHHAKSTQESIEAYMPPSAEAKRSSPF
jgi:hypothetical protein